MKPLNTLLVLLSILVLGANLALAQLPQPASVTVYSPNRQYFLVHQPKSSKISTYQRLGNGVEPKLMWTSYGKYREIAIADDGNHMVASIGNVIPTDYNDDVIVLTFFKRSQPIRHVRLKHVMGDYSKLIKTKKGQYVWGFFRGFDRNGHYEIETAEKKRIAFDVKTGLPVSAR